MKIKISLLISIVTIFSAFSQFNFSGEVSDDYFNATAYLSLIENCNKKSLFLTESIIKKSNINKQGIFIFKGDFLSDKNRIYKIHIDNCNDAISDYKHFLNHCDDSKEIIFIANNNDNIYFPLNNLSQIFCDIQQASTTNIAILKIEDFHNNLLNNLKNTKSDRQRKTVYFNHFIELQKFSKQFNEPLTELYTFYLYANENAISREFYLKDLKTSNYYNNLLSQLKISYPNTSYTSNYQTSLIKDQYPLLKSKQVTYKYLAIFLGVLLLISILINIKNKKKSVTIDPIKDYKNILTTQEQKVFELMLNNSNKEIASKLFVSVSTIKSHINSIYSKLSITSRKEIADFFNIP